MTLTGRVKPSISTRGRNEPQIRSEVDLTRSVDQTTLPLWERHREINRFEKIVDGLRLRNDIWIPNIIVIGASAIQ